MSTCTITNSKNSNAPKAAWNDDGRVNLLLFENFDKYKQFLLALGVPETLIGAGRATVVGTYANLAGYIMLAVYMDRYSLSRSMGVKKGDSAKFEMKQSTEYLAVFNNLNWTMYVNGPVNGGTNYTVTTLKPAKPGDLPSGTIVPN